MTTLVLRGLTCGYGRRPVVRDVDLSLAPGEIVAVLGANGAGKSTLLKTIMGLLPPVAGSLEMRGDDLTKRTARARFRMGIAWVPEGRRLFADLTVRENLLIGAHSRGVSWRERWDELIELFPVLERYLDRPSSALSGGEQQMVALGRAFLAQPDVLLLDEPSLGLAPLLVDAVMEAVAHLRSGDMSIVLVEQNVRAGLSIAQRALVIERGVVARSATAEELRADDSIIASYLSK